MASDAYSTVVLADGPTAYWRLDDTSTTAADLSGNGYNLTVGASVVKSQTGLLSVGSNTSMSFPNTSGLAYTCSNAARVTALEGTTISVEAWVKATAFNAGNGAGIYGYGALAGNPNFTMYLYSAAGTTAEIAVDANNTSGGGQMEVVSSSIMVTGTTYYLAYTYDGTTARTYLNGVANGTTAKSGTITGYGATPGPIIGQYWASTTASGGPFNGVVDEVAVYANKVLTPAQILNHYNTGKNLVATRVPYQPNYQGASILSQ